MALASDETARSLESFEVVLVVDGETFVHALPAKGEVVVGRDESVEVRVHHASVSRRHARLSLTSQGITIADLGSSNGTRLAPALVDGERTARAAEHALSPHETVPLPDGATVRLGQISLFVRRVPLATSAFVATSPALDEALAIVRRAARHSLPVLLVGETGVGKELFARHLHEGSPRHAGPFSVIACAALNPALVESELFGHERGSFTGASSAKLGLVEAARGGTVLLDEVAALPLTLQAKLLRVLEDGVVYPVGAVAPRPVDVRFVAATHADLETEVSLGNFRSDLLFRLNGLTVFVPPLRERRAEVGPLARYFARGVRGHAKTVSDAAIRLLEAHDWPGNVRELRNVVERAVVLTGEPELKPEHFELFAHPARPSVAHAAAALSERERIIEALANAAGNQTRAAELLGMSRRTLVTRLRDLDIPRPRGGRAT